ncbi:MAG: metal-dependent transcriptional regulator [Oscillospiraceae bacterium]|nr:metal-dependent transcriptional regulator [Oscillospiraceae bacterium]
MQKLRRSGEDYLEAILVVRNRAGEVRSVDIARELHVSKPSVSRAVGLLKDGGFINIDADGFISFTEAGRIVAESIYERHIVLTDWLTDLGVEKETAADDACKLEHDISKESFDRLKEHIEKCMQCETKDCLPLAPAT